MVTSQLPLWLDGDRAQEWLIRESGRARRLTVRVFHSGHVEVIVPSRTSAGAVERFVERHRSWIERKRQEAKTCALPATPFPPSRIELAACEQSWRVHLTGGQDRVGLRELGNGLLVVSGDARDAHGIRQALRDWLISRAGQVLAPALAQCAAELGVEYRRLLIRRQRTRWGSCSTRGTISLNCCLLFQRPPVVRYLLIHELAHTVHMNHSRRFWKTVGRFCSGYQRLDRELLNGWRRVPAWVFAEGGGNLP